MAEVHWWGNIIHCGANSANEITNEANKVTCQKCKDEMVFGYAPAYPDFPNGIEDKELNEKMKWCRALETEQNILADVL